MANNQDGQSYLGRLSPWSGSKSPAVKSAPSADQDSASADLGLKQTKGKDHKVTHRHKLSLRNYPKDCPPLLPQWFFATDVSKRRPNPLGVPAKDASRPTPKKYAPFSKTDTKSIETAFQALVEKEDAAEKDDESAARSTPSARQHEDQPNTTLEADQPWLKPGSVTVPVNEDYLFDVDVERRELAPAYWLGPVYEVRRGTWFYQGKRMTDRALVTAHGM